MNAEGELNDAELRQIQKQALTSQQPDHNRYLQPSSVKWVAGMLKIRTTAGTAITLAQRPRYSKVPAIRTEPSGWSSATAGNTPPKLADSGKPTDEQDGIRPTRI